MQVSVLDIANYSAKALLNDSIEPGSRSVKIFGPRLYSALEVKNVIEEITGKEGSLVPIERNDLSKWFATQVGKIYADEYVAMVTSMLPGGLITDEYSYDEDTIRGTTEMIDALRHLGPK